MKKEFWFERWKKQEIGFHQADINPYLHQFWHELKCAPGDQVFVPLCGKSQDMVWLQQQGHPVLGVELSPTAVEAFFKENGTVPQRHKQGAFDVSESGSIRILCGDFFDLEREDLQAVKAVYDRAALIALPPEMRKRYVSHLMRALPAGAQVLLITIEYPQEQMEGPPFSVSAEEVKSLYGAQVEIRLLERSGVLAENPRFKERGLNHLHENVFLIKRISAAES
ncbi:MAG: thiopurine S-methyltransferase [Alphaproteobacteria bacterium]|nr:thiopurine S-methyltransferase [Alphaproteobacteria bacterium]